MAEHWIVVPVVAGSSPVIHPIKLKPQLVFSLRFFFYPVITLMLISGSLSNRVGNAFPLRIYTFLYLP